IIAVLPRAAAISRLGADGGSVALRSIATVICAARIVAASVLGYHTIMKLQSVLTWITGAVTILYVLLTIPHIDLAAVMAQPGGSPGQVIGALVMVMTGFGLGWINIAADWSRYQKRSASDGAIIAWNTIGGSLAPVLLVIFGTLLAGSDPDLFDAVADDPIGALATQLPVWVLVPFRVAAVLALGAGAG